MLPLLPQAAPPCHHVFRSDDASPVSPASRRGDRTESGRPDTTTPGPHPAWLNTEQRTSHHRGDGTFTIDGEVVDRRDRMVLWKQFPD